MAEGDSALFVVSVSGATKPEYAWSRNGEPLDEEEATLVVQNATAADIGYYRVEVKDGEKSATSRPALLAVRPRPSPLIWDADFAGWAALVLGAGALVVLLPLLWLAFRIMHRGDLATSYGALVTVELIAIGVLLTATAAYAALLEFRGKARRSRPHKAEQTKEPEQRKDDAAASEAMTIPAVGELAKAVPGILRSFGQLQSMPAIAFMALVLFGAGAALAWHAPRPSSSTSSSTTSKGSSSTSTGSSSTTTGSSSTTTGSSSTTTGSSSTSSTTTSSVKSTTTATTSTTSTTTK